MIIRCSCIAVLLWMLAMPVFAAESLDAWSCSAPIHFAGNSKYKALFLTEEIYEHASPGLADLRIVDAQGGYVPFYIQNGFNTFRQNKSIYRSEVVQNYKKDNDSYIDFAVIPLKDNTDVAGNSLIFELPAGNFLKHIEIYGSYDGERWDYISKDYVFRENGREKNEVPLGNKRKYTYYRTVILNNPENIVFKNMSLSNTATETQWNGFVKTAPVNFDVKMDHNDSIVTLSNQQRLAIKQIILEVEANFQRDYRVYGDNRNGPPIKSGEIYNLQFENVKVSDTKIDFSSNSISAPVITIKIANRDDRPLAIRSVSIEYYIDKIVFPDIGNAPYQLYFGNSKAAKPQYEMELQKAYIEKEQQDHCELGIIQQIKKEEVPAANSFNMKYVFNGIIIAVSILLTGLLITRMNGKK